MVKEVIIKWMLITLMIGIVKGNIIPGGCVQYLGQICIRCSVGAHLEEGICYQNIVGCVKYTSDNECAQCQQPLYQLINTACVIAIDINNQSNQSNNLQNQIPKDSPNPVQQLGQSSFLLVPHEQVKNWPSFTALNNFVLLGQYGFYISKMSNSIQSVHYVLKGGQYTYKILYFASGGGLFLCIADVTPALLVNIRNMIPISNNYIVENCCNYDINGNCIQCKEGTHLEGGTCYPNYGGCIKYRENICLECKDYYFLIENRCVSDCISQSDARSILYYETILKNSTLELNYGVPISNFYPRLSSTTCQSSTILYPTITLNPSTQSTPFPPQFLPNPQYLSPSSQFPTITIPTSIIPTQISHQPKSITPLPLPWYLAYKTTQPVTQRTTFPLSPKNCSTNIKKIDAVISHSFEQNCEIRAQSGICAKCISQYFVNEDGLCQLIHPLCISISEIDGKCIECMKGYTVNNGRCNIVVQI